MGSGIGTLAAGSSLAAVRLALLVSVTTVNWLKASSASSELKQNKVSTYLNHVKT
jgi:hypothetical protein